MGGHIYAPVLKTIVEGNTYKKGGFLFFEQEATASAEAADAEPAAAATADAPEADADTSEPDDTPAQPSVKAAKGGTRRGRKRKH